MLARRTSCIQTYSGMYYKRKGLDLIVLDFSAGQIDSLSRDRFVSNEVVLVRIIVALICRGEYDRCKKLHLIRNAMLPCNRTYRERATMRIEQALVDGVSEAR